MYKLCYIHTIEGCIADNKWWNVLKSQVSVIESQNIFLGEHTSVIVIESQNIFQGEHTHTKVSYRKI